MKVKEKRCCIGCLKDENSVQIENELESKITDMYKTLVNVELNSLMLYNQETFRFSLCKYCIKKLSLIIDFQEQCLKSIVSLKGKLTFQPEIVLLVKEEPIDHMEEEIVCAPAYDGKSTVDLKIDETKDEELKNEPIIDEDAIEDDIHMDDDEEIIEENTANGTSMNLLEEVRQKYSKRISLHSKQKSTSPPSMFICELCYESFTTRKLLKDHVLKTKNHKGANICRFCLKIFLDKEEYNKHIEEENAKQQIPKTKSRKEFPCELCSHKYQTLKSLKRHREKVHERRFICEQCDKPFKLKKLLIRHVQFRHLDGKICKFCGKIFVDREEYRKHIEEEEVKPRPERATHCCEICGFTTKVKQSLKLHITKYQ